MGIHDGHRKNLRHDFLAVGLEGKQEHQALELLLTYTIPRIDVNPIAHELIDRFGSIAGVFDAEVEQLTSVKYISENTAVLIKLIPQLNRMYEKSKWGKKISLKNAAAVRDYMMPKFIGEKNENFYMLALDTHLNLIKEIKLSEGSSDFANVDIRYLTKEVLCLNAPQILLVHNHPSGSVLPSMDDIVTTNKIKSTMDSLNIILSDHLIFAGNDVFSFASKGMLANDAVNK